MIEPNPVFTSEKFKIIADVIQFESKSDAIYSIFSFEHEEEDIGLIVQS